MPDADYNVAPTTHQPIIRQSKETGDRELILARWGMVPFFTKELTDVKGLSTINARSETITKAPTWCEPFRKRRCLVPVSGFYEWAKFPAPPKQPYAFELSGGSTFAFAGLWTPGGIGKGTGCSPERRAEGRSLETPCGVPVTAVDCALGGAAEGTGIKCCAAHAPLTSWILLS